MTMLFPTNTTTRRLTIQAAQRQINAILSGRTTASSSIKAFTNQAKPNKNGNCSRPVPLTLFCSYVPKE